MPDFEREDVNGAAAAAFEAGTCVPVSVRRVQKQVGVRVLRQID